MGVSTSLGQCKAAKIVKVGIGPITNHESVSPELK